MPPRSPRTQVRSWSWWCRAADLFAQPPAHLVGDPAQAPGAEADRGRGVGTGHDLAGTGEPTPTAAATSRIVQSGSSGTGAALTARASPARRRVRQARSRASDRHDRLFGASVLRRVGSVHGSTRQSAPGVPNRTRRPPGNRRDGAIADGLQEAPTTQLRTATGARDRRRWRSVATAPCRPVEACSGPARKPVVGGLWETPPDRDGRGRRSVANAGGR